MVKDFERSESQELMALCLSCKLPECVGGSGCEEYKALKKPTTTHKAKPAKKQRMVVEFAPIALMGEKQVLECCNAAIAALGKLANAESGNMILPTETIQDCLKQLRAARNEAYEHLVDWDSVINAIVEE